MRIAALSSTPSAQPSAQPRRYPLTTSRAGRPHILLIFLLDLHRQSRNTTNQPPQAPSDLNGHPRIPPHTKKIKNKKISRRRSAEVLTAGRGGGMQAPAHGAINIR